MSNKFGEQSAHAQQRAIEDAALAGDASRCRELLDAAKSTCPSSGGWEHSALELLCERGEEAACRVLIQAGADVNAMPPKWSPLMLAASHGYLGICEALIAAGADIAYRRESNDSALEWAFANDHVDVVILLLQSGADPDELDGKGRTPLLRAAELGSAAMCDALIRGGANVGFVDGKGVGAAYLAILNHELEALRVLAGAGLPRTVSINGLPELTPFQFAVRMGPIPVVDFLISCAGEDPSQVTNDGRTMLQLAGQNEQMKAFLRASRTVRDIDRVVVCAESSSAKVSRGRSSGFSPL
jgi:hypothetical protein